MQSNPKYRDKLMTNRLYRIIETSMAKPVQADIESVNKASETNAYT